MISSVIITGFLDKKFNERFRYIKTSNINILTTNHDEVISYIPLLYWTRDCSNPLLNIEDGKFIIIQGKIECDKTVGLYVLVETLRLSA